jgi:hypothetical protein
MPRFSKLAVNQLRLHFENRICHNCGEYLDFPTERLKRSNKKRRPRHLSCQKPKSDMPRYHHVHIYASHIFSPRFIQTIPFSGVIISTCPILLRVKQKFPLFWSEFSIRESVTSRKIHSIHFPLREWRDFPYGVLSLEEEDFVVLPFLCQGEPLQILQFIDSRSKDELEELALQYGFQSHTLNHVLQFMLQRVDSIQYDRQDCAVIEDVIRNLICPKDSLTKLALLKKLDMNHLAVSYYDWFKEILLEFPEFLTDLEENILMQFFNHNRRWFLTTLCRKRPIVYKYITFEYQD